MQPVGSSQAAHPQNHDPSGDSEDEGLILIRVLDDGVQSPPERRIVDQQVDRIERQLSRSGQH